MDLFSILLVGENISRKFLRKGVERNGLNRLDGLIRYAISTEGGSGIRGKDHCGGSERSHCDCGRSIQRQRRRSVDKGGF